MTDSQALDGVDERLPASVVDNRLAELQPDISQEFDKLRTTAWTVADPLILELCRVRLAQLLGDPDAAASRTAPAVAAGLREDKVAALTSWSTSPLFDDADRAFLAFTEQFNLAVSSTSDEDVAALTAHRSESEVGHFVMALYVVEMEMRLRMVARRVLRLETTE